MEKENYKRDEVIFIDTNIFVDHLRGFEKAILFFELIKEKEDVLFSAITEAELVAGKSCNDTTKKDKLLNFLSKWNKIEVSNIIALKAGDISRDYDMPIPDAIIAASAIINKAELLTKNTKDFSAVKELKIRAPY